MSDGRRAVNTSDEGARFDKTAARAGRTLDLIDTFERQSLHVEDRRSPVLEVVLKRFDRPDEVRTFEKGRFEIVHIGGMSIGRATYQPGWKWSEHVGPGLGRTSCEVEHVGIVIAGCATAAMDDGRVVELRAGDIFHIPPGHDSWVIGDEPYVSLHFMGAGEYAAARQSVLVESAEIDPVPARSPPGP